MQKKAVDISNVFPPAYLNYIKDLVVHIWVKNVLASARVLQKGVLPTPWIRGMTIYESVNTMALASILSLGLAAGSKVWANEAWGQPTIINNNSNFIKAANTYILPWQTPSSHSSSWTKSHLGLVDSWNATCTPRSLRGSSFPLGRSDVLRLLRWVCLLVQCFRP